MFVYKIQVNPIHTILKYGIYNDFMDNGAVLKRSSQWQLKEFWKLNNSGHELFIFIILLIAIDWNFPVKLFQNWTSGSRGQDF